jgi:hypothetical protein
MKQNVQHVGSRLLKPNSMELAWYITGFTDGEGCFSISFTKREKLITGIEIRPSFSLAQNKKNLQVLKTIYTYFGCGAIRFSKNDQTYKYEVRSIKDLQTKVIPHFKKYPPQTAKLSDFTKFEQICNLISQSKHLNKGYLVEIIELAYSMNESGKRKYAKQDLLKNIEAR